MTLYDADQAISAISARVLAPGAPMCHGWDALDPAGCWTHDRPKATDYCQGFKLFDGYLRARNYAESLEVPFALSYDTVAERWAVEPMEQIPGC